MTESTEALRRLTADLPPGRLMGRGHAAGDFLEAYEWEVLEESPGVLRVACHLPEHTKNPRGQLFGGFTPTYVDLVSLYTVRAGRPRDEMGWMATTNMRIDYFEPVMGPRFHLEGRLEKSRGRTHFVAARFYVGPAFDQLAVFSLTTMREIKVSSPLGDG